MESESSNKKEKENMATKRTKDSSLNQKQQMIKVAVTSLWDGSVLQQHYGWLYDQNNYAHSKKWNIYKSQKMSSQTIKACNIKTS